MILECADRGARARRQRARGRSRRVLRRGARARRRRIRASRVVREEVTDAAVARHRRHRPAHLGSRSREAIRARLGVERARVLRRDRADRLARFDRPRRRLPRVALRQGDDGGGRRGRVSQLPDDARAVRSVHRRAHRGRPVPRPRVRRGAVLRGLHAGRGDGEARARDAALRADEARGPARSAHRARGARRRAAAHGGPRRADVESRRLPDAAPHPGAAARVPDDSRARERRVPALRLASTGTRTSTRRPRSRRTLALRDDPRRSFAGQLTGVEGYTESTATGLLAGINLSRMLAGEAAGAFRRRPRCSARSTAICARPTRSTSSR